MPVLTVRVAPTAPPATVAIQLVDRDGYPAWDEHDGSREIRRCN